MTAKAFSQEMGMSVYNYCNAEAGRLRVSPSTIVGYAKRSGACQRSFLRAALLDICHEVGFGGRVEVKIK